MSDLFRPRYFLNLVRGAPTKDGPGMHWDTLAVDCEDLRGLRMLARDLSMIRYVDDRSHVDPALREYSPYGVVEVCEHVYNGGKYQGAEIKFRYTNGMEATI